MAKKVRIIIFWRSITLLSLCIGLTALLFIIRNSGLQSDISTLIHGSLSPSSQNSNENSPSPIASTLAGQPTNARKLLSNVCKGLDRYGIGFIGHNPMPFAEFCLAAIQVLLIIYTLPRTLKIHRWGELTLNKTAKVVGKIISKTTPSNWPTDAANLGGVLLTMAGIYGCWIMLSCIGKCATLSKSEEFLRYFTWGVVTLVIAWMGLRIAIIWHFANMGDSLEEGPDEQLPSNLLGFQERIVKELAEKALTPGSSEINLVALEGQWGTGKSVILEGLEHHLETRETQPRWIIVRLNVWRYEGTVDLHRHLFERVLSHSKLFAFSAHRYPLRFILAGVPRFFTSLAVKLHLKVVEADMGGGLTLDWQRELEGFIRRIRRAKMRLLVLVDEAERASPDAIQETVTLLRRSLTVPGVFVVFSYVREALRFKVFNPLMDLPPNLRADINTVLYRKTGLMDDFGKLVNEARTSFCEISDSTFSTTENKRQAIPQSFERALFWAVQKATSAINGPTQKQALERVLLDFWINTDSDQRARLSFEFEEKYFWRIVTLPRLEPKTMLEIAVRYFSNGLTAVWQRSDEENRKSVINKCDRALRVLDVRANRNLTPNLRRFCGFVGKFTSVLSNDFDEGRFGDLEASEKFFFETLPLLIALAAKLSQIQSEK